ncbi:response regulator [Chitinophaga agrisoli]|uniref:Response regulator n=1 Tax=Chitinophaga agrisoli TaxID=2607653 RepID=A0A5B2VUH2_9BACT|nr:response regulator [Chitinophaga agrisoli]KAA2241709.1 response regulator [Chitinophaga agrisoli]
MKKINVLLVENDEDEQLFMKEGFLTTQLYNVLGVAGNGEEAVAVMQEIQEILPDLIISDLNMPGMNGLDLLQYVKNNSTLAHIPVIITSTSFTPTVIDKCMLSGAYAYHTKPDSFIEYDKFAEKIYHEWLQQYS